MITVRNRVFMSASTSFASEFDDRKVWSGFVTMNPMSTIPAVKGGLGSPARAGMNKERINDSWPPGFVSIKYTILIEIDAPARKITSLHMAAGEREPCKLMELMELIDRNPSQQLKDVSLPIFKTKVKLESKS